LCKTETNNNNYSQRINFEDDSLLKDPFSIYSYLRKNKPVSQIDPGGAWAVTRYADAKYVLQHPEYFSSSGCQGFLYPKNIKGKPLPDLVLLFGDPPDDTEYSEYLKSINIGNIIDDLKPFIFSKAKSLAKRLKAKSSADLLSDFSNPLVESMTGRIIGIQDRKYLKRWSNWFEVITQSNHQSKINNNPLQSLFTDLCSLVDLHQHSAKYGVMAELNRCGTTISKFQLTKLLEVLIVSAIYPMNQFIAQAIMYLSYNKSLFSLLANDKSKIPLFIDEFTRCYPIVHYLERRSTKNIELSKTMIPAGSSVIVIVASANRDPEQFPFPDTFDISRHNSKSQLSFGSGVHACWGTNITKICMSTALDVITKNFSNISCPKRENLSWYYCLSVYGLHSLPATFN
jgi:cytochrome P450